jgi:hypothetical protein
MNTQGRSHVRCPDELYADRAYDYDIYHDQVRAEGITTQARGRR